jgi:hypothetical protein
VEPVKVTVASPSEPPVTGDFSISTFSTSPYIEKYVIIWASVVRGERCDMRTDVGGAGPFEFSSN